MSAAATPCLFLSHSGADTDAARELKRRILVSPAARASGLTVWFDKDDLVASTDTWQAQLEEALEKRMTAFAVYVGSGGVVNWVEREVRAGLSRATGNEGIPFIPILSKDAGDERVLPFFARQHQAIRDPLGDESALAALVVAATDNARGDPVLLEHPFVGLRSMTEAEADRFFGREVEIEEVLALMRRFRVIAIVAESGSGKSSLAQAGIIPRYRGGALEDQARLQPEGRIRHVLVMRPQSDPVRALRDAVTRAGEALGLTGQQRDSLRQRIDLSDPERTAYALQCDLPVDKVDTLLVVDQFEELITQTPKELRGPFAALLAHLASRGGQAGFRVLLTVRSDYFVPSREVAGLRNLLTGTCAEAVYRLKRVSDSGIGELIRRPLALAGHHDRDEQDALVRLVQRDAMDRPGDLALIQAVLHAMWVRRHDWGDDLVRAYAELGGVAGALASEAEKARSALGEQGNLLLSVMVRLIRLGTTGGVTRRVAPLSEFDPLRRELITKLSTDDFGRLLLVTDEAVEVAHEALITQWAWLNDLINERGEGFDTPRDIRRLEQLEDRALAWLVGGKDIEQFGSTGAELEGFQQLKTRRPDWLSEEERQFISTSATAVKARQRRTRILYGSLAALLIAAIAVVVAQAVQTAALRARTSESELGKLVSDARRALDSDDVAGALRLAAEVLKSTTDRDSLLRGAALEVAYAGLQRRTPIETFEGEIVGSRGGAIRYIRRTGSGTSIFERKGNVEQKLATMGANFGPCNFDYCINSRRIFVIDRALEIALPPGHYAFAPINATSLLTTNTEDADGYSSGIELFRFDFDDRQPQALGHFSGDPEWGKVSAYTSAPAPAFIILGDGGDNEEGGQPAPGALATIFRGRSDARVPLLAFGSSYFPRLAVFDPDATRVLTAPGDPSQGLPSATVWDVSTGRALASASATEAQINDAVFLEGSRRFVIGSATGLLEIFNATDGQRIAALANFAGSVIDIDFDPASGRLCALWSTGVIGVWDSVSLLRLERISLSAATTPTGILCRDASMFVSLTGERKMIQRWNIANDWRSEIKVTTSVPPSDYLIMGFGFDPVSGTPAIDYGSEVGDCKVRWTEIGLAPCGGELLDDTAEKYGWTFLPAEAVGSGYFVRGNQFCVETEANGSSVRKTCPVVLEGQSVAYVQAGEAHWFVVTRDDEAPRHNLVVIDVRTPAKVGEIEGIPFGKLDNIQNLQVDEKLQNLFVFRSDGTIQIWKLRERSLVVEAQSRFILQGAGWSTQAIDLRRGLLATYGDGVVRSYRYDVPLDQIVRSLDQVAARERPPGEEM